MRKPRVVMGGIALGVALFLVTLAIFCAALPSQNDRDTGVNYDYVYSGARSQSIPFNAAGLSEDSLFLFGSSELSTSANLVAQVPAKVFGENDYGLDLVYVGEAYDQSLWHAIAIGAYEPQVRDDRKIVFVVSPTWFEDAGLDESTFKLRFSYVLYRAFCENPDIPQSSKDHLANRLAYYGIDQTTIQAGSGDTFVDELNNAAFLWAEDIKLRKELMDVRTKGISVIDSNQEGNTAEPDFEALHYQALNDAVINSTNNAWGMDDGFYANSIEGRLERLRGSQADEHFANAEELKDFSFLLKVCGELDLDVLVVIPPVHGDFYDYVGVDREDRQACYDRIIKLCESNGVKYADFSNREYEQYFLHDIVHFGNTGWVDVEEAIYTFVKDSSKEVSRDDWRITQE